MDFVSGAQEVLENLVKICIKAQQVKNGFAMPF
jgi:hypothetical protein